MHGSISCNTSNKSETQRCVNNKHVEASDSYCRVLLFSTCDKLALSVTLVNEI